MPLTPQGGALIGGTGLSLALALGQLISGQQRSPLELANEQRRLGLEERQRSGNLGLSSQEQVARNRQLISPTRSFAEEARRRAEAVGAATGQTSGAAINQARAAQQRQIGQASLEAANLIALEDAERERQQLAELAALEAAQEQARLARRQSLFGAIGQTAGTLGALAAVPPGTFQSSGLFGTQLRRSELQADPIGALMDFGFTPDEAARISQGGLRSIRQAIRQRLLQQGQTAGGSIPNTA
jgi:hypothetical protein